MQYKNIELLQTNLLSEYWAKNVKKEQHWLLLSPWQLDIAYIEVIRGLFHDNWWAPAALPLRHG